MSQPASPTPKLALIVITRNEEALIGQCLRSASCCDELIVVDSHSTDRTVEIAQSLGAKVYPREFEGYISQKQFALEQATAQWVLSLDADEQLIESSRDEIAAVLREGAEAEGYEIRRVLFHLGHYYMREIYPDYHLRLFQRSLAHFGGREPHAKAIVEGRVRRLRQPMLHFSYRDIADHIATINRLTDRAALEGTPGPFTALRMISNPVWRFFNFYFLRGGFLDGGRGLYAAMAAAFYVFAKYAKLYERKCKLYLAQ